MRFFGIFHGPSKFARGASALWLIFLRNSCRRVPSHFVRDRYRGFMQGEFLMLFKNNRTVSTLLTVSLMAFPALTLGQTSTSSGQSGSDKNHKEDSAPKNKQKDKKSNGNSKKGDNSRRPMDERAPIPNRPGRMDNPTLPQRTPGQQPAPGSSDPTSPTTTKPQ
jgi:hypothetical protein